MSLTSEEDQTSTRSTCLLLRTSQPRNLGWKASLLWVRSSAVVHEGLPMYHHEMQCNAEYAWIGERSTEERGILTDERKSNELPSILSIACRQC